MAGHRTLGFAGRIAFLSRGLGDLFVSSRSWPANVQIVEPTGNCSRAAAVRAPEALAARQCAHHSNLHASCGFWPVWHSRNRADVAAAEGLGCSVRVALLHSTLGIGSIFLVALVSTTHCGHGRGIRLSWDFRGQAFAKMAGGGWLERAWTGNRSSVTCARHSDLGFLGRNNCSTILRVMLRPVERFRCSSCCYTAGASRIAVGLAFLRNLAVSSCFQS
mmetsp:Transcript_64186/g.150494  ORF Transcript_64186/g.150494 Transcript_64186/m.150494 type:complete len:219 (+) Transcript_64186:790-1446(+)